MKVLLSWIRDFVDVPGTPEEIGRRMSMRGLALEGIEPAPEGAVPPGREAGGPDAILDFDVTANRPDCLSMLGVAREIATVYGLPLRVPGPAADGLLRTAALTPADRDHLSVAMEAPDICPRYAGAAAEVAVAPSPRWVRARLEACGVRPISNVVDVTNYVLLEIGQPMHAFDLARLAGPAIVARRARAGEPITTLDGKARALTAGMLVIADADRPQAIGGVMGGAESEVSSASRRIVLEAAYFKPQSVRATAKALGLRTEASYRFERGADPTAPVRAMARAAALLEIVGAGRAVGTVVDACPSPIAPAVVTLEHGQASRLLGMPVPDEDAVRILTALGFGVEEAKGRWRVTVPGWRVDVSRPVDLIEEIGRHHGYEHLPATFPGVAAAPPPSDPRIPRDQRARRALLAMGFSEAITFGFVDDQAAAPFLDGQAPVRLANPLSEKFTTMRPSLVPGLVDAVSHNRRHGRRDVRLFEIGTRFSPSGETRAAAAAWTGLATPDHWSGGRRDVDFFDMKGAVEQVAAMLDVPVAIAPADAAYLVPGRSAAVLAGGAVVGRLGQLAPEVADARDLPGGDAVYVAEIDLDALEAARADAPRFARPLPRHPSVVRDVSILVDDTLSADTVRGTIRTAGPETLVLVQEFDRYQGKGIPDGKCSLSVRLTFQAPDRTLTDDEVQSAMQGIVDALGRELGAVQR
ncbi:MAG: phenylalanine--tRNA ligase subunit beta [Vicinamibacterales bacterium]